MMITRRPWGYGSAIKDRDYLKRDEPFESIVQELSVALAAVDQSAVRFRMEPMDGKFSGGDPLLGRLQCKRASWHIALDSVLLDKFFNGRMGIRAQYYLSPYQGHFMNRLILSTLRDRLVELALSIQPSVAGDLLELSLTQPSARAWISEKDLTGKKIIRASDLALVEEELQNDWLDVARALKNGELGAEHYQLYAAAINGVRAPIADQLEVKSADHRSRSLRVRDTQQTRPRLPIVHVRIHLNMDAYNPSIERTHNRLHWLRSAHVKP